MSPATPTARADGTITAKLYLQPDFVQTVVGKYLFKLSSPGGPLCSDHKCLCGHEFPPTRRNSPARWPATAWPCPNAVVILFDGSNQNLNTVGATVANNAGPLHDFPRRQERICCSGLQDQFCGGLGGGGEPGCWAPGATFSTNLNLIAATQSISGKVVDASNSSLGLPALLLPVQTQNGLLGICFTPTPTAISPRA